MAELNKTLHIKKGSTEQIVKLYTTTEEAGEAYSCIKVDDMQVYIPLGTESDSRATIGRVKKHNGSQWAILTSGKPPYHMDSYTNAGTYTWTCPTGVTQVRVTVAGGGGGGVAIYSHYGAVKQHASGGRGAKITTTHPVSSGHTYSVIVGGGGSPKVREADFITDSGKASDGSSSSFDTLHAQGGSGGSYDKLACAEGTSYAKVVKGEMLGIQEQMQEKQVG